MAAMISFEKSGSLLALAMFMAPETATSARRRFLAAAVQLIDHEVDQVFKLLGVGLADLRALARDIGAEGGEGALAGFSAFDIAVEEGGEGSSGGRPRRSLLPFVGALVDRAGAGLGDQLAALFLKCT